MSMEACFLNNDIKLNYKLTMKFFLDTASIDQIKIWKKFDVVDGVTTNPTLLSKEGCDPINQLNHK